MIDWIFFDVGGVLFNDDRQNFLAYQRAHQIIRQTEPEFLFSDMMTEREALVRSGENRILQTILASHSKSADARRLLTEIRESLDSCYDDNHLLNDGLRPLLDRLRGRYRLGVIANQPHECRNSLQRRNILEFFDVVAISDELNLYKPDKQLFEWAVNEANCDPRRSIMIGDRRDNDVFPATELSMKTILVRWPSHKQKRWQPDSPEATAFLESCDRFGLFDRHTGNCEPDRTVSSLFELNEAIDSLDAKD